jgi:uncharacterized repeat protein (TIGR02543 family)
MTTTVTLITGSTNPWLCPTGVQSIHVQGIAGGGAGASNSALATGGGGGGGGASAQRNFVTTPGNSYAYAIGAAGTSGTTPVNGGNTTFNTNTIVAAGGKSAAYNGATRGAGGLASACTPTSGAFSGGNGFTTATTSGGGGGGSAGTAGNGNSAASQTGATAVTGGGPGGDGGLTKNDGLAPLSGYGGGGGGSGSNTKAGGAGYAGQIIITYNTLTFNGNGNTGGSAPATASYYPGATVTVPGNTGSMTDTGFVFSHWNTASNGSGTSYYPGGTITLSADTTLYAIWGYTVTYNGNGNTSGAVMPDVGGPYPSGATVTVLDNVNKKPPISPTLNTGNTLYSGMVGAWLFTEGADTGVPTLGDSSGALNPATGINLATPAIAGNGWGAGPDGTMLTFDGTTTYATVGQGNGNNLQLTVGSVFAKIKTTSALAVNAGIICKADAYSLFVISGALNFYDWTTGPNLSTTLVNDGNWHTVGAVFSSGSSLGSAIYIDGNQDAGSPITMTVADQTYPVVLAADNASGQITNPFTGSIEWIMVWNRKITALEIASLQSGAFSIWTVFGPLARAGYAFNGWNTAADGSGTARAAGATFAISSSVTLYAQWKPTTQLIWIKMISLAALVSTAATTALSLVHNLFSELARRFRLVDENN